MATIERLFVLFAAVACGCGSREPTGVESQAVEAVSTNGGLLLAAKIIASRTGARVGYEQFPRQIPDLHFTRQRDEFGELSTRAKYDPPIAFSYPADASPEEALQAAVDEYNGSVDAFAQYGIVQHGATLVLRPLRVRTASGVIAYDSPLDVTVSVDSADAAQEAYVDFVSVLSRTLNEGVEDGRWGLTMDDQTSCNSLVHSGCQGYTSKGSAYAWQVLSDVVASSDYAVFWSFISVAGEEPQWIVTWDIARSEAELQR